MPVNVYMKTGKWEKATGDTFKGKTIRVTGTVNNPAPNQANPTLVTTSAQVQVVRADLKGRGKWSESRLVDTSDPLDRGTVNQTR